MVGAIVGRVGQTVGTCVGTADGALVRKVGVGVGAADGALERRVGTLVGWKAASALFRQGVAASRQNALICCALVDSLVVGDKVGCKVGGT